MIRNLTRQVLTRSIDDMIATHYTLYCDVCRRSGPGPMGGSADRQAERRIARRHGWKRIPKGSPDDTSRDGRGEDLCPVCARQRRIS